MKNILIAASIAALMSGSAMAQTTATTPAPASDNPVIVVLPPVTQGAAPAHFLIDDLDDEDVYGVDGAKIGEIEDFVVDTEGQIAAVVIEVGGFLGIGEKEVLVDWSALDIQVTDGDLRVNAPTLTREELEAAADVDVGGSFELFAGQRRCVDAQVAVGDLDVEGGPIHQNFLLADAEEAADLDHDRRDLTFGVDDEVLDLADLGAIDAVDILIVQIVDQEMRGRGALRDRRQHNDDRVVGGRRRRRGGGLRHRASAHQGCNAGGDQDVLHKCLSVRKPTPANAPSACGVRKAPAHALVPILPLTELRFSSDGFPSCPA